jgi:bifunctional non-homologous end joining protein LigD
VCEVRYKERTDDGLLRQPVFLRMREDKAPEECISERHFAQSEPDGNPKPSQGQGIGEPARAVDELPETREAGSPPGNEDAIASDRKVPFTNLGKIFWPEDGYTKGDLIDARDRLLHLR